MRQNLFFLFLFLTAMTYAETTISIGDTTQATIPCFDLTEIESATPEQRALLIQKFGDGLRDVGFVAVYAPEVTPKVEEAKRVMKIYFAQNHQTKMKDWHDNAGQSGFAFKGLETAAGAPQADIKETFFIINNMPSWPKAPNEFAMVMDDYLDTLSAYSDKVIGYLWEYLGETHEVSAGTILNGDRRIRLAYYPSSKNSDHPRAVWAAAHQDLNAVTLLPRPSRSGLQLKTKEGKWLAVTVPPNYIIINCGDQITKKTAGYITGTEHQVINDDLQNPDPRYSTILFAVLPDQYSLKPFEKCAEKATAGMTPSEAEQYLCQFTDVTVKENLTARLIEMGSWKNPQEELILDLRSKGLINNPCVALKKNFPHIFK